MHKALIGIAVAATLGLATVAAPSTANARCFGCAVGVGVAAGLIGGALIGGAIANNPPPPPPAYYPPPPPPGRPPMGRRRPSMLSLPRAATGAGRTRCGSRATVGSGAVTHLPVIQSGS